MAIYEYKLGNNLNKDCIICEHPLYKHKIETSMPLIDNIKYIEYKLRCHGRENVEERYSTCQCNAGFEKCMYELNIKKG